MLVEVSETGSFGVVGSVVGVVAVVVVVQSGLCVFKHPEGMVGGGGEADMDGAGSVGLGKNIQS